MNRGSILVALLIPVSSLLLLPLPSSLPAARSAKPAPPRAATATCSAIVGGRLILLRHGESIWNSPEKARFTGWANVELSARGEQEARDAGDLLLDPEQPHIDVCYTSVLKRATLTAEICLERLAEAGRRRPRVVSRWRLNERHYGALTGQNKRTALRDFDLEQLLFWRSSFEGRPPPMEPPHPHYSRVEHRYERLVAAASADDEELTLGDVPLTESLADTRERVRPLWCNELLPTVQGGQNVLVVGHANCLRALISCIQPELSEEHLPSLGLPNALPLIFGFDAEGRAVVEPGKCYVEPLRAHYLGDGPPAPGRLALTAGARYSRTAVQLPQPVGPSPSWTPKARAPSARPSSRAASALGATCPPAAGATFGPNPALSGLPPPAQLNPFAMQILRAALRGRAVGLPRLGLRRLRRLRRGRALAGRLHI